MRLVLTAALLIASPAAAQSGGYKLIVAFNDGGGIAVIDYPSAERCERARLALVADRDEKIRQSRENAAPGSIVVGVPYHFVGVCIPA